MRFSGVSSLTVGAWVLVDDFLVSWSTSGSHWSAVLCFAGLVGLTTLSVWSEKYNAGRILLPTTENSPRDHQIPTANRLQLG